MSMIEGHNWRVLFAGAIAMVLGFKMHGATLTLTTNVLGPTPDILAYNSGHFFTNSNTKDWWRYAGVSGARVFLSPSQIEPSDDLAPVGDGVNSQASFLSRKAALRADPLNLSYINWTGSSVFNNRYENNDLYPNNHIKPNYTFREMRKLGIQVCAQITASQSRFPIAGTNDWPNMWELWQHYYAQAFYLGRYFDVERYQMFNEPNHPNANGLTIANHLLRLQLVSDAVQSAITDVNALYGKSLSPRILAPATAGSAAGSYPGWGESVVTNRHLNFLGQTDTNFSLIHVYDYHQYNSSPSGFGTSLATLHSLLTAELSPAPRYPTSISEFNTRTGATFDTMTETLDTPSEYARFGAICVNLLANACAEFYCFKFSQTERAPPTTYPVAKNAMHYVDNASSPYNVGGITKAGEVYRLFNKAFATGRSRLNTTKGGDATSFDVHASYDPVRKRYHLFSVNNTASGVTIELALSTLPVPVGNRVLLEEVSESTYGGGKLWTSVPANKTIAAGSQDSNTVWLLTVPVEPQAAEQILAATDDAEVRDGSNKNNNYGGSTAMTARNDPASTANRSAAFLKFNLGGIALTNIEFALLSFQAASATTNATAQAHVYALDATNWSQGAITWAAAPNLKQNVTAGNTIAKQCVTGAGDSAFIMGQVVVNSTNASERLLDVTDWLRARTNSAVSFLVAQDPRWDVELPSLATGDTQPDGVMILTTESGNGPRLRIVLKSAGGPVGGTPYWTNLLVATEAVVRGGTSAALDVDEIATGYLMMKYNAAPFDAARKAYFQFELTGLNLVANTQAVFTVGFLNTFKQNAQLWALNQAYTNFTSALTWNTAQANDTASNNLLSGGALNATTIGPVTNLPASSTTPVSLAIPNIGNYLLSNRLTLVLSGSPDAGSFTNNASGLRMLRTNATLQVLVIPPAPPVSYQPPLITSIIANPDGSITMSFSGATNRTHWLQANTNLATGSWVSISTNVSSGNGAWSVTDSGSTNFQQRFYRAVLP